MYDLANSNEIPIKTSRTAKILIGVVSVFSDISLTTLILKKNQHFTFNL